jgi:pyrroline-5-carboxylate reductase
MGSALLGGLLSSGFVTAEQCAICEVRAESLGLLGSRFPGVTLNADPVDADAVVLAVKPSDLAEACRGLSEHRYGRVLSIVAGATTASIEKLLWPAAVVIRAMPNTPALIGAGASAISPGAWAGAEDLDWAEAVLSSIGKVVRVPEAQLDAVTGLSGSGPAYIFLVAEALIEAADAAGLPGEVAEGLVVQTLLGSARMLAESGHSPAELREAVTSPGGTTAAALEVFERAGLKAIFLEAVLAATERSRALGQSD